MNGHDISVLSRSICHHGLVVKAKCPLCISSYEQEKRDKDQRTRLLSVLDTPNSAFYEVNKPRQAYGQPITVRHQGHLFKVWGVIDQMEAQEVARKAHWSLFRR